jgi:hypothetical protein
MTSVLVQPPWCPLGIHSTLRGCEVIFIDYIVTFEHRYCLVPGDLHRRERIHSCPPQVCRRSEAQVMKDDSVSPASRHIRLKISRMDLLGEPRRTNTYSTR